MIKKVIKIFVLLISVLLIIVLFLVYYQYNNYKKLESVEINNFGLEVIPFTLSNSGHIIVNVKLNGDDTLYPFILDSGASNIIFKNKLSKFQFENNGLGIGKGANGNYFLTDIKKIESLTIKKILFENFNANEVEHNFDCFDDYYGIIGLGLMHNLNWQIDFDEQEIIVSENFEELTFNQNRIELDLIENQFSHHLSIPLKLNTISSNIYPVIDLGNSGYLSLNENIIFKDSLKLNSREIIGKKDFGLGNTKSKEKSKKIYHIDSLITNSNYSFKDLTFNSSPNSLDLLGLGVFKNYKTTISWSERKLILEHNNKQNNFNDKTFGFGITLSDESKKIIISSITKDSEADLKGFELGAEVQMINNLKFKNAKSLCIFKDEISKNNSITIKLKMNDDIKTYKLFKKKLFKHKTLNPKPQP